MKKRRTTSPVPVPQPRSIARTMRIPCDECGQTFVVSIGERETNHRPRRCMACYRRDRVAPYDPPRNTNSMPKTPAPECIVWLGLSWPCTVEDVKQCWRRFALKHHPDVGGQAAEFIIARGHYEAALKLFDEVSR